MNSPLEILLVEDIRAAYQHGANSCIMKPMDFQSYLGVVGKIGLYWLKMNLSSTV